MSRIDPGDEQGRQAPQGRARPVRRRRRRRLALGRGLLPRRRSSRVDPKRFRVVKRIRVGARPWDVAYGFGSVWSSNQNDGTVSRIDPKTNKVVKTIHTGGSPTCIRAGRRLDLGRVAEHGRHLSDRSGDEPRHERSGSGTRASSASTRIPTASGSRTTPPAASRASTRRRTRSSRRSRSAAGPPTACAGPTASSGSRTTATGRSRVIDPATNTRRRHGHGRRQAVRRAERVRRHLGRRLRRLDDQADQALKRQRGRHTPALELQAQKGFVTSSRPCPACRRPCRRRPSRAPRRRSPRW